MKMAIVAETSKGAEMEMERRSAWDEYFARKKEELLERFGRGWGADLV